MGWIVTVSSVYIVIAAVALMMTRREQLGQGHGRLLPRLAGCVACVLWPLAFTVILIEAQRRGA